MTLAQQVAQRVNELQMPIEEIQDARLGSFYHHGWVLVTRDLPDERHASWIFVPDANLLEVIETILAYSDERE